MWQKAIYVASACFRTVETPTKKRTRQQFSQTFT